MRQRCEMSVKQFQRRNPTLRFVHVIPAVSPTPKGFTALVRKDGRDYACGWGKTPGKAVYDAAERCYKLASLDTMEVQDWKDANTGQTGIGLDAHHIQKRSAGRLDSTENLAGVSRGVHNAQHGQPEFSKSLRRGAGRNR